MEVIVDIKEQLILFQKKNMYKLSNHGEVKNNVLILTHLHVIINQ